METFSYRARTESGELAAGTWTAATEMEALDELREQGLFVMRLQRRSMRAFPSVRFLSLEQDSVDAALVCRQLSVLLHSGFPLRESLSAMIGEGGGREKELLVSLRQGVEQGRPFSELLREHGDVFPEMAVAVAAVGEAAGRLPEMMQQLAAWMEQEQRAREKLKTVLLYPAILFAETMAIACFLTVVVLPAFAELFLSMDAKLPLPTRLLLDWSAFVQEDGLWLLGGLVALGVAIFRWSRRPRVRLAIDRWRLKGPIFGRLQREVLWMKTFRALSVLLACAVPLDEALAQAGRVAGNRHVAERLESVAQSVRQGFPLSEALAGEPSLPPLLLEMLRTGEAAGRLPEMLREGAAYASMMAENHAARLQAMAEPAAYVVIFALVGTIVAAVALPWLDMMTLFV